MNLFFCNLSDFFRVGYLRLSLLFSFLFFFSFLIAQSNEIILDNGEQLYVKEGLSGRIVTCLYEDSEGFIWVGTSLGVNRYDGHRFLPFSNSMVTFILEDKNKCIWVIPISNFGEYVISEIEIIDPIANEKKKIEDIYREKDFLTQKILDFKQDSLYNLWFSTSAGEVYKFDGQKLFLVYKNETGKPIRKVLPLNENELILIEQKNLIRWTKDAGVVEKEEIFYEVEKIWLGQNDRIWIKRNYPFKKVKQGSDKGTLKQVTELYYKDRGKAVQRFQLQDELSLTAPGNFALSQMGDGNLWYFMKDHYRCYDPYGKLLTKYILPKEAQEEIGLYNIENSYYGSKHIIGKDGTLWVVSNTGVLKFSNKSSKFKNIVNQNSGVPFSIRGIIDIDKDNLLVCVYGLGFVKVEMKGNKINQLAFNRSSPYAFVATTKDRYGNIWLGTHGPYLHKYVATNQNDKGYELLSYRFDALVQFEIPYYDSFNGRLWIGSAVGGLFYFDDEKEAILPYQQLNEYEHLKDTRITCFFQNDEKLWIGTDKGIYILDPVKGIVEWHNDFYIKEIMAIHHANDGYIWLAGNGGLVRLDPSNNKQKLFSIKNGFPDDYLYTIYPDEFGFLWIPSNKGLIRFNVSNFEVNTFLSSAGISHEEFNRFSHFKDQKGRFYFGGLNGITAFNPSDFLETKINPVEVKLTELSFVKNTSGEHVNGLPAFNKLNKIDWLPSMKSFQIRFMLQDYSLANRQSYAYMIEGLDDDWIYINENYLRFNQLPYGKYNLKIKGIGGKGLWSKPISIPLQVVQPFYKTWWFFTIVALAFLGFIFSMFRWRVKTLEREVVKRTRQIEKDRQLIQSQYEELELLNKGKDRFYTIIAHDLRDPVTAFKGIAGKINYLINRNEPKRVYQLAEYVEKSADNLSKLLENLLSWAEQQRGELLFRPSKHKFISLVNEVFKILEIFAEKKGVKLKYKGDADLEIFGDFHMLGTILRNLTHNAIKFSHPDGNVIVDCKIENNNTVFTVTDFGIGIRENDRKLLFKIKTTPTAIGTLGEKGTGLGLVLCHDLVRKHQGKIFVEGKKGENTVFTVSIPFEEN